MLNQNNFVVRLKEGTFLIMSFKSIAFFITVCFKLKWTHILPVTTFAETINYCCVEIGNYTLL